jgi:hypothetical protein
VVIKVEAGLLKYELNLERKITYLTGMSAEGKSSLLKAVATAIRTGIGLSGINADQIMLLSDDINAHWLIQKEYSLCVLDLDCLNISKDMSRTINSKSAYFLLIGRAVTGVASIHYKSVVEFRLDEQSWHKFDAVRAAKVIEGFQPELPTLVEDTGAGFEFYKRYFQTLGNRDIRGLGGFGKIPVHVNALLKTEPKLQVIADASTFGNIIYDIEDITRLVCFLPECVEQIFLKCPMFEQEYEDAYLQNFLNYKSSEQFYEKELIRQLAPAHSRYIKGKLHPCLSQSCRLCAKRQNCSLFNTYIRPEAIWEAALLKAEEFSVWS